MQSIVCSATDRRADMEKRPFSAYQGEEPYIFVSYAHADSARVYPLITDLHERGVNIWYDEGIEPGSKWREELAGAIQDAAQILFVASEKSVASPNCERELDYALSHNIPVSVVYIEKVDLPPALSFSLGSHQGIFESHYDTQTFRDKVFDLVSKAPDKILGVIPTGHRNRLSIWLAAAALLLTTLAIYVGTRPAPTEEGAERASIDITPTLEDPVRIAINPLNNVTGDTEIGWISDGLANLLRDQLSASRYAVVLSPNAWRSIADNAAQGGDIAALARDAGVDYLISGEMLGDDDAFLATMRVTNLRAGIDVMAQTFPDLTPEALINSSERIATNAKQAMKIPREDGLQSLAADFVTGNIGAYEAFVEGLERNISFDYPGAEQSMRAALALAPDFHIARYRLADILYLTSQREAAKAEIAKIPGDAVQDQRESLYIKAFSQFLNAQYDNAIETYQEILKAYPYEVEAQQRLARVYYETFQEQKSVDILTTLRRQEPENPYVLGALGYQLTSIGELEAAEEVLADYLERHPDLPNAWHLNAALKLRRTDLAGAEADFSKALSLEADYTDSRIGLAKTLALKGELNTATARFLSIRDDDTQLPRHRIDAAFAVADLHRALEQPEYVDDDLAPVEEMIRGEGVRVGLYWYTKAQAQIDRGASDRALETLATAKREDDGVPTRFVHLEGVIKARRGDNIDQELAILQENRLPEDNPDRTEDKAILHLEGIAAMHAGDAGAAVDKLRQAVDLYGYEYGVYRVELAEALFAAGKNREALKEIEAARSQHNNLLSGDLRLDLLHHQHQAGHVLASFYERTGQDRKAKALLTELHDQIDVDRP